MHFILLCILIGAIIMIPAVRDFLGQGCLLFIVGFLALVGAGLLISLLFFAGG
jgi:hypothetical protein